ncbi:hypothetical protein, partial [bacterium endosymbiont of Bathymodiolus sp. 5 South]|uniref:hypothetical protein n=1 Tax=bacterium endosymbiont of Bathymodiolus sp. 5 South TaxID=1181670 RepID=UPI001117E8B0
MKVIKLFITSILLLSSFQTFAAFSITTAANVSTPENTDKVIKLTVNKNGFNEVTFGKRKFTMSGKDVNKFTISGEDLKSKLTFKATAFEAGSDNTYSVNIKAEFRFMTETSSIAYTQTTEKTITVTVTKNPDNGEHVPTFRITTANVSTPENTDKVIKLTVNKNGFNELIFGRRKFTMSGKDVNKFTISDEDLKSKLTFKATAFEAGSDNTYSVNIKAEFRFMTGPSSVAYTQTTEKTITVTVTKDPDNGEHVPTFHITTVDVSTPENTDKVIMLATNIDDLKYKTTFTITGGADVKKFTLAGNKLTFKATAFEARKDATYRVKIKATPNIFLPLPGTGLEDEKTLTVTVTKANTGGNPDDNGALRITTADVSTPENTDKVITLITNKSDTNVFKNMLTIFTIVDGADAKRFTLKKGNKLTFKATAFKAQSNTYRVKIKVFQERFDRGFSPWAFPPSETAYKTLTVTVTKNPDDNGKYVPTFRITTDNVSTPENTDKVIMLATNIDDLKYKTTFTITGGADVKKFTLAGNKLTFKATAFEARKDATYRVKIKATPDIFLWILLFSQTTEKTIVDWIPQTTEKTITVTVTKNPDNGKYVPTFRITTDNVSTPENTDKVIMLATNIDDLKYETNFTITGGADVKKFTLAGNKLTFKATAFEARKDATYRVKIKAALGTGISFFDWILLFPQTTEKTIVDWIPQTTEKTITVTVTKANTGGNPDDNGALRITTADAFSTPENNPNMVISLTTNKDANKDVDVNFSITGGADQGEVGL